MTTGRHFTKARAGLFGSAIIGLGLLLTAAAPVSAQATDEPPADTAIAERQAWPDTPYRAMGGLRETRKREQAIRNAFQRPRGDLDCTFFVSQAFNKTADHYATRMAEMCAMLSEYKRVVIANNSARYKAARDSDQGNPYRPEVPSQVAEMPTASDSGKYLIAREIGLIDALGE